MSTKSTKQNYFIATDSKQYQELHEMAGDKPIVVDFSASWYIPFLFLFCFCFVPLFFFLFFVFVKRFYVSCFIKSFIVVVFFVCGKLGVDHVKPLVLFLNPCPQNIPIWYLLRSTLTNWKVLPIKQKCHRFHAFTFTKIQNLKEPWSELTAKN
jgi:hypothetical protein